MDITLRNKNILIASTQNWYSPFLSKHYLAIELTKENHVYFVNPPRFIHKLNKPYKKFHDETNENLSVLTPQWLPKSHSFPLAKIVSLLIFKYTYRKIIKSINLIITFNPIYHVLSECFPGIPIIYYCVDYYPLPGIEKNILEKANIIIVSSRALLEKHSGVYPNTFYLPHGIDFPDNKPMVRETSSTNLKSPIIGFIGNICKRLDYRLIYKMITTYPDYSFVFAGPYAESLLGEGLDNSQLTMLKSFNNVSLTGEIPKDLIDSYIAEFDICIIPYDTDLENIKYCNPIKTLQYLRCGKPIVSTSFPEINIIKDLAYVAKSADEFIELINYALKNETESKRYARINFAKKQSWASRLSRLEVLVNEHI